MNFSYSDSEDDELEVVVDGYGGHESFNNEEEMVDDDGSEPEGGENSHHDLDRLRGRGDPRVEEDSETDVTVTPLHPQQKQIKKQKQKQIRNRTDMKS